MRLTELYNAIDEEAPFALSQAYCAAYGAHDNSGVQAECGEVTGVLFSLDLSPAAIGRAERAGLNCIVTHHPAIYYPLSSLCERGAGALVLACVRKGISVVSAHLNLDCAPGGIDESLMRALGGEKEEGVMHRVEGGAYGRVYCVEEQSFAAFSKGAEGALGAKRVMRFGERPVRRVASFCGAGCDGDSVSFAIAAGADTFVSSDGKHHCLAQLIGAGLNVLLFTHYATEEYGFARFHEKIDKKIKGAGVRTHLFTDERFL